MENAEKLASVLEWMRLNNVKSYSESPTGAFSVERFEEQMPVMLGKDESPDSVGPTQAGQPDAQYGSEELFFDGVIPKIKRVEKK